MNCHLFSLRLPLRRAAGVFAATAAATLGLAGCGDKPAASAAPPAATAVTLEPARRLAAVYYDEYPATVAALNTVELRAQVSGFLTGLFFREGEVVAKGKTLYEIDRRKYQAAYQQALANLQAARATAANAGVNQQRYERLAAQDAIAGQILDNARTATLTAQSQVAAVAAAVTAARTDLDYSLIKAPVTGRIGLSQVRLGAQVSAGSTLLNTLSGENPMAVDFAVSEKEIARFSELQGRKKPAAADSTFRLVLPDGAPYAPTGHLTVVDRGVDQQSGTLKVRVEFANPDRRLKDGMSAVLRVLNRQSGQRIVVPNKAVVEQMGESFVFVVTDTVAHQRKVQLGPRLRNQIVVLEGLAEGEQVVTEGLGRLRDGGVVKPNAPSAAVPAAPPQAAAPAAR